MTAPTDASAMAAMDRAGQLLARCSAGEDGAIEAAENLDSARDHIASMLADVEPILRSLRERITRDNAMDPQAVMVRRAWGSLMRCKGEQP